MNKNRDNQIKTILNSISLEQKAELCSGRGSWFLRGLAAQGIKDLLICDGPHGLRKMAEEGRLEELEESVPATCFPPAATLASSWNRELIDRVGEAIAEEAAAENVSVVLGPGANIKRSPLCGRNFEYFSEDPYLSGELSAAMINGIQRINIGSSLKHFAVNNQEKLRMTIDAVVDERTLREIYLAGFERAVKKSSPWTIMCAYNKLNGDYLSDNHYILSDILRTEWGFEGIVISDWGACNNRVDALAAGMEIEMPYSGRYNIETIINAVETGKLPEDVLNTAAGRIINILLAANEKLQDTSPNVSGSDLEAHQNLARKAAAESIVLMKNEKGMLPLKSSDKLAVIGEFAVNPRYQGAGSSRINPTKVETFYEQIKTHYPDASYTQGYTLGSTPGDKAADQLILAQALEAASRADKVIVLAGLPDEFESEGFDRSDMKLPESHNRLIEALIKTGKPVIVCLSNGSPVEMPWNNEAAAVVEGYLGGQAGAGALSDVLCGRENPSGRLAESFPLQLEDTPSYSYFPGGPRQVEYREGIYVGYRYYDTAGVQVLYPFGHGLSYTTFEYSMLTVSRTEITDNTDAEAFNLTVSLNVKNTGICSGKETVQLYIGSPDDNLNHGPHRPAKELKDFIKIELAAGADMNVSFKLDFRSFACYDVKTGSWIVPAGAYKIHAGSSSADIRLSSTIKAGTAASKKPASSPVSDYSQVRNRPGIIHSISDDSFEAELGKKIPANIPSGGWSRTTTLTEFSKTLIGKIILNHALKMTAQYSSNNENSAGMYEAVAREMPLRSLAQLSNQSLNMEMTDAIIMLGSGKLFKGISALLYGWRKLKNDRALDQLL